MTIVRIIVITCSIFTHYVFSFFSHLTLEKERDKGDEEKESNHSLLQRYPDLRATGWTREAIPGIWGRLATVTISWRPEDSPLHRRHDMMTPGRFGLRKLKGFRHMKIILRYQSKQQYLVKFKERGVLHSTYESYLKWTWMNIPTMNKKDSNPFTEDMAALPKINTC